MPIGVEAATRPMLIRMNLRRLYRSVIWNSPLSGAHWQHGTRPGGPARLTMIVKGSEGVWKAPLRARHGAWPAPSIPAGLAETGPTRCRRVGALADSDRIIVSTSSFLKAEARMDMRPCGDCPAQLERPGHVARPRSWHGASRPMIRPFEKAQRAYY
jgi:hypothetical protein